MGEIITGRISTSNNIATSTNTITNSNIGVVYDVILDENSEYLKKYDEKIRLTFIGGAVYRQQDGFGVSSKDLDIALPLDKTLKNLPTINEQIQLVKTGLGVFYHRIEPTNETPNNSAIINQISYKLESKQENSNATPNVESYKLTEQTNITNTTNSSEAKKYDVLGKYFQFTPNIHKLKLYEGDTLIESRFGQSIRLSAYNNVNNQSPSFSPTLIIRNGESAVNRAKRVDLSIEEDINRDGSTIALTSNNYQFNFQPGTVDANGKSDFETKPESFVDYPSILKGDQILLNSGRIILSAKNAEMIFYSKKNYGFISDGNLSIDNKLGIDVNVRDNINILTNDRDIFMSTGAGKIFLGSKDPEPMVKGKQLVQILGEILDAIGDLQFKTPAGPSAIGSENRKVFEGIKGKLNNILSTLNQTS